MYTFNPATDRPAARINECQGGNKLILAFVSCLLTRIKEWQRYRRDEKHLLALDNYMLRDIGLSRGEIRAAIWRGNQWLLKEKSS